MTAKKFSLLLVIATMGVVLSGCSTQFLPIKDSNHTDNTHTGGELPPLDIPANYTQPSESDPLTVNHQPVTLEGRRLQVGDTLADVVLDKPADYFDQVTTGTISQTSGYKLIYTVPSLDTPVCTKQTKELEAAMKEFPNESFIVVSLDTPYAIKRFCLANSISNVHTFSDARTREYGIKNGFFVPQYGILARAVTIVDQNMKVVYVDYTEEITDETDLLNAFAFLKHLEKQDQEAAK